MLFILQRVVFKLPGYWPGQSVILHDPWHCTELLEQILMEWCNIQFHVCGKWILKYLGLMDMENALIFFFNFFLLQEYMYIV